MAKVLYISYDGMTDPLGQSQVIPYLKKLSKMGHSIVLLSTEKKHAFAEQYFFISEDLKEAGIEWHYISYTKTPPVLSTVLDIFMLLKKAKYLDRIHSFDIIHCRSYIAALIGLRFKTKYSIPFIFDMRGFWADERVEGKIWNLKNPLFAAIYSLFKRLEVRFLEQADYTISLTNKAKELIESREELKKHNVKIQVIPCCADLDHFDSSKITEKDVDIVLHELGLTKDNYIVSYVGSIGTWYMLPEMLQFFKILKNSKPLAKFLFISKDNPEIIYMEVKKQNIDIQDIIIKSTKRSETPFYLAISNISLFFIIPTYSKQASSPTKMGEIMGMGIPLLCNSGVGDVGDIVKDTNCGICIDTFTSEDFNAAIAKLDNLAFIPKEKIRAGAQKYYSLEEGSRRYNFVYKTIHS